MTFKSSLHIQFLYERIFVVIAINLLSGYGYMRCILTSMFLNNKLIDVIQSFRRYDKFSSLGGIYFLKKNSYLKNVTLIGPNSCMDDTMSY